MTTNVTVDSPASSRAAPFTPGREGLRRLAFALRHPETWPDGFVWNFSYCENCAMGLACQLWMEDAPNFSDADDEHRAYVSFIAHRLAVPFDDVQSLFLSADWAKRTMTKWFGLVKIERKFPFEKITPGMVADAIDRYLAAT
jgi:hypothetical protein